MADNFSKSGTRKRLDRGETLEQVTERMSTPTADTGMAREWLKRPENDVGFPEHANADCGGHLIDAGCLRCRIQVAMEAYAASRLSTREQEVGWISVEERLPENGQQVLCFTVRRKPMNPQHWMDAAYYSANYGFDIEDQSCFGEPEVTHWRPLPEPPGAALDKVRGRG